MPRRGVPGGCQLSGGCDGRLLRCPGIGPAIALIAVVVLWPVFVMFEHVLPALQPRWFPARPGRVAELRRTLRRGRTVRNPGTHRHLGSGGGRGHHADLAGAGTAVQSAARPAFRTVGAHRPVGRLRRDDVSDLPWALDPNSGVINVFLHNMGLIKSFGSNEADWLGRPVAAFTWMVAVAIFVSLPFTTYALLAGLQTIPGELYEAARVDGASHWQSYRSITLPLLRPSFLVAVLINVINVFNSFPIIWEMTQGGPGHETATSTVFMYQLKEAYIGESAALSVINFALVIVVVLVFLKVTRWRDQVT